jgi:hypothetical protein
MCPALTKQCVGFLKMLFGSGTQLLVVDFSTLQVKETDGYIKRSKFKGMVRKWRGGE